MTNAEKQEIYDAAYAEAFGEPLQFVKHDADAARNRKLQKLVYVNGMAYYGWYWRLAECLAKRRGHFYDMTDPIDARALLLDMEVIADIGADTLSWFIDTLANLELIETDIYEESGRVMMCRITETAHECAHKSAQGKVGAIKQRQAGAK